MRKATSNLHWWPFYFVYLQQRNIAEVQGIDGDRIKWQSKRCFQAEWFSSNVYVKTRGEKHLFAK